VARVDDALREALKSLPAKPKDTSPAPTKKAYSEGMSKKLAEVIAEELRNRGLKGARPGLPGSVGVSGAERQMAGGIGAKKVDVTWATPESGLLFATSVKTINFRDNKTKNNQKNLTNRRGDMLFEAVTLHRRFPYAVLGGFFFLDEGAEADATGRRRSTFENAHQRLRLFTGRRDPAGRDEQYERLYVVLVDANRFKPRVEAYQAGQTKTSTPFGAIFDDLIDLVAERNPDFYESDGTGNLRPI
jgi:hypothetical protein